jgi:hypothetical protein
MWEAKGIDYIELHLWANDVIAMRFEVLMDHGTPVEQMKAATQKQ